MQANRYHHIFDISHCSEKTHTTHTIDAFIKRIAEVTDMTILSGPVVVEGVPENPGVTGFAIIDYSHISIHSFTETNTALVDVFSCKPYEKEAVLALCKEYLTTADSNIREKEVYWG